MKLRTEKPKTQKEKLPAGVYRRPGSQYLWIRYSVNGMPVRDSTRTTVPQEAAEERRLRMAEIAVGQRRHEYGKRPVMLSELYADMVDDYRFQGRKSLDDLEDRWECHLQGWFGHLRADQVTTAHIKQYIAAKMSDTDADGKRLASNATINRTLAVLKRMFNLGRESTPPKVTVVPYIPMLAEDNIRTGFLEQAERARVREECAAVGTWMLGIFETGVWLAWRHSQVLSLEVRQVDFEQGILRAEGHQTKTGKPNEIPIPAELAALLKECAKGKKGHEPLFTRPNGARVKNFRGSWQNITAAAGVPGLLFHDLRRTAARAMRRAKLAERVCMEIGGWKTTSTFHRYGIVDAGEMKQAMKDYAESQRSQERQLRAAVGDSGKRVEMPRRKGATGMKRPVHDSRRGEKNDTMAGAESTFRAQSEKKSQDFAGDTSTDRDDNQEENQGVTWYRERDSNPHAPFGAADFKPVRAIPKNRVNKRKTTE